MAARIRSLEIRTDQLNGARPDLSAYKTIAEMFPHALLLPRLQRLAYSLPYRDENVELDLKVRLELESLLTPSLIAFSFDAEEPFCDTIVDSVASNCPGITTLTWRRRYFSAHLPRSLSRLSMLRSLDLSAVALDNEILRLVSTFSALLGLRVLFDVDWHRKRKDSGQNVVGILGNLETLEISGLNEDIFQFFSCLNGSRLRRLVVILMWEAPRAWPSIRNVISSLRTLSLTFKSSNRPDHPIVIEKLLEPFAHATEITELSIELHWWTKGNTLDRHLSELLENFPLLESLAVKFLVGGYHWPHMASLQLLANAATTCPKLKTIRFVGNINTTLLDGPVMHSFAELRKLDLRGSRAGDVYGRRVTVDRGMLEEFIERIAPGLGMDRVTLD